MYEYNVPSKKTSIQCHEYEFERVHDVYFYQYATVSTDQDE